jgi:hypothetical protein
MEEKQPRLSVAVWGSVSSVYSYNLHYVKLRPKLELFILQNRWFAQSCSHSVQKLVPS